MVTYFKFLNSNAVVCRGMLRAGCPCGVAQVLGHALKKNRTLRSLELHDILGFQRGGRFEAGKPFRPERPCCPLPKALAAVQAVIDALTTENDTLERVVLPLRKTLEPIGKYKDFRDVLASVMPLKHLEPAFHGSLTQKTRLDSE